MQLFDSSDTLYEVLALAACEHLNQWGTLMPRLAIISTPPSTPSNIGNLDNLVCNGPDIRSKRLGHMGDSIDNACEAVVNKQNAATVNHATQKPQADASDVPDPDTNAAEGDNGGKTVYEDNPMSGESTRHTISSENTSEEELPPPLPPRPGNLDLSETQPSTSLGSLPRPNKSSRPHLQSNPTTAVSLTDIHAQSFQDGSRETYASSSERAPYRKPLGGHNSFGRHPSRNGSEADESGSVKSYGPTLEARGDVESLLGEVLGPGEESPAWKLLGSHVEGVNPFDLLAHDDVEATADFSREFDELGEIDGNGENGGTTFSVTILMLCQHD